MARRRLTHWVVEDMVRTLENDSDTCLVLTSDMTPTMGPVRVTRAGKRWTMKRYLYFRVTGSELPQALALIPGRCNTVGCLNPFHHTASRRRRPRVATECPNGHEYTPSNIIHGGKYKCRTCYEARKASRRESEYPHGWCRKGHRLTGKNVYRYTTKDGVRKRKCRRCALERQRAYRARREERS